MQTAVQCRIAHVVGSSIHVVLDTGMEAVLGIANSYDEAVVIAQTIEIRNMVFDFEKVYEIYPRKIGKKSGIAWLKRHVKSVSRYNLVLEAAANYRDYVRDAEIEPQYTFHFCTWVKKFEDWTNENQPDNPRHPPPAKNALLPELSDDDIERLLLSGPSKKLL